MIPKDSISGLSSPTIARAVLSAKLSEIEREVMDIFEQFRDPLLRYALSFGIPVHDAEEVTQEVFLCLFRHLQLRRSRKNLRGWIFRVAHNLALKQLYANQQSYKTTSDRQIAEEHADPSPDPEEQLSLAQRRHRLLAVVKAACGRSPLPGNRSRPGNVSGSRIDIADTITGTVDPCGREIKIC
jgi:DNA-directed RNA polymerase specialized sigma24 family protein